MKLELIDREAGGALLVISTESAIDRMALRQLTSCKVRINSTGWKQTGNIETLTLLFEPEDKPNKFKCPHDNWYGSCLKCQESYDREMR